MGSSVCELLEGENYVLLISDESVASTEQKGRMKEKKEGKVKKTVNQVRETGSNEKAHIPPGGKNRNIWATWGCIPTGPHQLDRVPYSCLSHLVQLLRCLPGPSLTHSHQHHCLFLD